MRVLLLNSSFEPLSLVSLQRAIGLLLTNKAEPVELSDYLLRSPQTALEVPLVIRLVRYVAIPYRHGVPCTRRAILVRDGERCQYCGNAPGREHLTIDHVV